MALPEGSVRHYLLSAETITVGRGEGNLIVLDWETVSSHHCTLRRLHAGYEIVDEGSTNGTKLGGKELGGKPRLLRDGDSLVIGMNVKARLVEVEEIVDRETSRSVDGASTMKLEKRPKLPAMPEINPVAAAVAKAEKRKL